MGKDNRVPANCRLIAAELDLSLRTVKDSINKLVKKHIFISEEGTNYLILNPHLAVADNISKIHYDNFSFIDVGKKGERLQIHEKDFINPVKKNSI